MGGYYFFLPPVEMHLTIVTYICLNVWMTLILGGPLHKSSWSRSIADTTSDIQLSWEVNFISLPIGMVHGISSILILRSIAKKKIHHLLPAFRINYCSTCLHPALHSKEILP